MLTAGCGPTVAVSSTLSNGRSLYLQASFTEGTVSLTAIGAADVPAGTAGTLEILGPVDWSCPGVFTAYPARDYDGLPWANIPLFTVGGDPEQGFDGPAGNYRFRLTLTSPRGSVQASVYADVTQGYTEALQTGCVQSSGGG